MKELVAEVNFDLAKYGKSNEAVTEKLRLTCSFDSEAYIEVMVKTSAIEQVP